MTKIPTDLGPALDPEVRAELGLTLEHFNEGHPDTVLLMARFIGGAPTATEAEAIDVDSGGIDLRVDADGTQRSVRLDFTAPAWTTADAQAQVMAALAAARAAAGVDEPLTSLERELQTTAKLLTHRSRVAAVDDLTPNLRRIILEGGLEQYEPRGADDFAYVFVERAPGVTEIDDDFSMTRWQAMPEGHRPLGAYYTVRRFDRAAGTIELWMVLHHHEGGVGGWAHRAKIGDTVALWGPRHAFDPPHEPSHLLLVADESGMAAVTALLDELDHETSATVVLETVDAHHEIQLTDRPRTTIHWLHRGQTAPGLGDGFLPKLRGLSLDPATTVAFGAGESRQITAVRRYLRQELGFGSDRVFMTGYWRR